MVLNYYLLCHSYIVDCDDCDDETIKALFTELEWKANRRSNWNTIYFIRFCQGIGKIRKELPRKLTYSCNDEDRKIQHP